MRDVSAEARPTCGAAQARTLGVREWEMIQELIQGEAIAHSDFQENGELLSSNQIQSEYWARYTQQPQRGQ